MRLGIVEVLDVSRGQIPLIIGNLDVYPLDPCQIGAPTLNSEEPHVYRYFAAVSLAVRACGSLSNSRFASYQATRSRSSSTRASAAVRMNSEMLMPNDSA